MSEGWSIPGRSGMAARPRRDDLSSPLVVITILNINISMYSTRPNGSKGTSRTAGSTSRPQIPRCSRLVASRSRWTQRQVPRTSLTVLLACARSRSCSSRSAHRRGPDADRRGQGSVKPLPGHRPLPEIRRGIGAGRRRVGWPDRRRAFRPQEPHRPFMPRWLTQPLIDVRHGHLAELPIASWSVSRSVRSAS